MEIALKKKVNRGHPPNKKRKSEGKSARAAEHCAAI
jgi:hypothetical protein